MVRLDERLGRITKLYVDRKKYFVINKGRQYGKTTTLRALAKYLDGDYIVFSLDFQQMGTRACLKNHSRHLYAPLCVIFAPHSVDVARYASFI